jgi:hypothetical protein
VWPVIAGVVIYLVEPVRRLVWSIFTLGNSSFQDPFFFDNFRWQALWMGFAGGAMLFVFYSIVRKWSPATRFDLGQNVICREGVAVNLMGYRFRLEELRMKLTDARAVQLCYGGFEKGDSESPGYDWWQLLVVGIGNPPFRAIVAQSATRKKLTDVGREIASYLSVPWIDDGDFREAVVDGDDSEGGRLENGVHVSAGSSLDVPLDAKVTHEDLLRQSSAGLKRFGVVFVLVAAFLGYFIWSTSNKEEEERLARMPQLAPPGPAEVVELTDLLANGAKYNGKKVRTTGYLRPVSFLMDFYGSGHHLDLFALSAEPMDLSKRQKGGMIGDVAVTNVMVQTTQPMGHAFVRMVPPNVTPKRIITGRFSFDGKFHNLTLSSWARDPEESRALPIAGQN